MSLWDTVTITIGEDTISNDVYEVDIWAEELFYCTRFEIKLINEADEWHSDFDVSDDVTISVSGTTLFVGYLDDVEEQTGDDGANHSIMILKGRGTSFYLQNLYHTGNYPDGTYSKADDIIFDALYDAQSGLAEAEQITYTSPSTASVTAIKFSKTFLLDAFKELAERIYYNGYVDNSKVLHFFAQGAAAEHTSTDLVLDSNVGNSNILRFLWGEQIGSSIKNYIEFYAGSVKDHWTDYVTDIDGVAAWANVTNAVAPVNETYYKLPRGVCSIEIAANATEALPTTTEFTVGLAFPRYNYTSINLRNDAEGSYWTYNEYPGTTTGYEYIRPQLVDQIGNVIEFVKDLVSTDDLGVTEDIAPFRWTCVKFPMGESLTIKSTTTGGYWYYKTTAATYSVLSGAWSNADLDAPTGRMILSGGTLVPSTSFAIGQKIVLSSCENAANDGTYTIKALGANYIDVWETIDVDNDTDTTMVLAAGFDWEHVTAIRIHCGYQAVAAVKPKVYIDYLTLPQVSVISLQESAASSLLYKKRMYRESHPEVVNQNQLDEMAEAYLARYKDPLSILRVTARGQTGTLYAGQSLDVQAPPYGINALTKYRITKLHHKISNRNAFKKASNFITEYDLIEHSVGGSTVYSDSYRVNSFYNPQLTSIDRLKDFRDRLSIDDTTDDVHTYYRIPNDGEIVANGVISGSITGNMIVSGAIITHHLSSGTVTTNQILSGAVTTYTIASGAIVTDLIAANAITVWHISANSVTANQLNANAVTTDKLYAYAVTADKLAANAVYTGSIQANSITAGLIAANAIVANNITANAITANKIQANAVTSDKIIGQSISIDKLATNVGSPGVQFLYSKFSQYTQTGNQPWGTFHYTRGIPAEDKLKYQARILGMELEDGQGVGTIILLCSGYGYVDVPTGLSTNASGLLVTGILTSSTNIYTKFGLDQLGAGSYSFKQPALSTNNIALSSGFGVTGTAHGGAGRVVISGAGTAQGFRMYTYQASGWVLSDFSQYNYITLSTLTTNISASLAVKLVLSTDTSGANAYYYTVNTSSNYVNAGTTTYTDAAIQFNSMTVTGAPTLTDIKKLSVEVTNAVPWDAGSEVEIGGLGLIKADYVRTINTYGSSGGTWLDFSDVLTSTYITAVSSDIRIYYLSNHGADMRYPTSDVRGISYLKDVDA